MGRGGELRKIHNVHSGRHGFSLEMGIAGIHKSKGFLIPKNGSWTQKTVSEINLSGSKWQVCQCLVSIDQGLVSIYSDYDHRRIILSSQSIRRFHECIFDPD